LEEFIVENKFNLVLIINDQSSILKIQHLLYNLSFGASDIFIDCIVEKKIIKIKIKENIKLSKTLLVDLSKIKGIKNIIYT